MEEPSVGLMDAQCHTTEKAGFQLTIPDLEGLEQDLFIFIFQKIILLLLTSVHLLILSMIRAKRKFPRCLWFLLKLVKQKINISNITKEQIWLNTFGDYVGVDFQYVCIYLYIYIKVINLKGGSYQ